MTQSVSEEDVLKKWSPIIENMGLTGSKADWMSDYAEMHSINENQISTTSSNDFPSAMPMVRRVFSKTVGLDLVAVKPMSSPGGNSQEEIDRIKAEIAAENRNSKIESIIEDKEYEEKIITDHPEYKGPGGQLFYLDYKYGASQSKK